MAEKVNELSPLELVAVATENMEELLRAETYDEEGLLTSFTDLEKQVFAATGTNQLGTVDGLIQLSGYCGRALQCVIECSNDRDTAELFYVGKADTYRTMLESLQPKPAQPAKQTDTRTKAMSNSKSKI